MGPVPSIELTPGRWIGENRPCYLVAEAGQNHNGQVAIARRLIESVAGSGAGVKARKGQKTDDECDGTKKHDAYVLAM